jgi:16S rRNA (cytosine967-C5)-methyltransferase
LKDLKIKDSAIKYSEIATRIAAIEAAYRVLYKGRSLDEVMEEMRDNPQMSGRDFAFATYLLHLIVKNKVRYCNFLQDFLREPLTKMNVKAVLILLCGVAQLKHMQVPDYATVNSSVDLFKHYKMPHLTGLCNAVLKKAIQTEISQVSLTDAPDWTSQILISDYGKEDATSIWCASMNDIAHTDLTFKNPELLQTYQAEHNWQHLFGNSLRVQNAGKISELVGYAKGDWWVQDLAAHLPIYGVRGLLQHDAKILDLCAAPGGKTMQLASMGAVVTAVDRSRARLNILQQNLHRTGLDAEIMQLDLQKQNQLEADYYDLVVLDAPCSATGTLRRNPEIIYQLKPEDINKLMQLQAELLEVASKLVVMGGYLLYIVCSLFQCEGEQQISKFLQENKDFVKADFDLSADFIGQNGDYRTLPHYNCENGGMDGFFAAVLQKIN